MLSFIYRITVDFEKRNGIAPNLLYLNESHARCLIAEFDETLGFDDIKEMLGMEIVIRREVVHPNVLWTAALAQKAG